MKLPLLMLGGLMAAAGSASAQSGSITFNGAVENYTCVVSAGGNAGSTDATINLPTVTGASMAAVGARAGMRPFTIVVGSGTEPCMAGSVAARWMPGGANVDPDTGRLSNESGAGMAQGVQVVLLNDRQQDIDVRDSSHSQEVAIVSGIGTLDYHGEYIGIGGMSEGAVNTSVQYELDYR